MKNVIYLRKFQISLNNGKVIESGSFVRIRSETQGIGQAIPKRKTPDLHPSNRSSFSILSGMMAQGKWLFQLIDSVLNMITLIT